ncbi:MAG: hypothetical protein KF819_22505 [Labilithrix sp.]|nr:hypothetical protein [Labilithrix sp.]
MRKSLVGVLAGVLLVLFGSGVAQAQKPTSQTTEYSPYERETIKRAIEATGLVIDPSPEGKIVERIDTLRLEVLEDRDPIPEEVLGVKTRKLLNTLHYTSRDFVIRREMLVKEGDPYVQVLVDETARNMRSRMPLQVSIVIIVPVKGSAPDRVALLVIAKDIWSLRLSFDMAVTPGGLENFLLVPQETNLFGWHHTAQTRFQYQPETLSFGVGYAIPRFGKSWIGASASVGIIINQRSGEPEGSTGGISVGQGLYSTRTEWAWGADASYGIGVSRRYVNARVATFDSRATPDVLDNIPNQYRTRSSSGSVGVTRSFGWGFKNNFSLTMNASTSDYETLGIPAGVNPDAQADFVNRFIPRGESRVFPRLSWATFTTNFLRTLDINTLALQEDYRLGHDISASIYPVSRALGSTRDLVGVSGKVGYALPLGDGLVGASVSTFAETCLDACDTVEKGSLSDASVGASFGAVTPRVGFGRFVMNMSFSNRYRNYLRARTFTGGDDRLRGYPSNYFFGKDTVFYNLEFRTSAVRLLSAAFGAVAFYDAGDAFNGTGFPNQFNALRAKQSLGFGVRALFPQVNRLVFRADLAFPLRRGPFPETGIPTQVDPVGFFFAFDQAFSP